MKEECQSTGMNDRFMELLDRFRETLGRPVILNSAERCKNHPVENTPDKRENLAKKDLPGAHVLGCAVDVKVNSSQDRYKVLKTAFALGFEGIAFEGDFVHIDCFSGKLSRPCTWLY